MPSIYDMADTWNDAGTTFTAIRMNVTDTASAAESKLLDLLVGGVSKFSVDKDGVITSANGTLLSDMTETWDSAGTVYTAIKMNVANTASATGSKLLDLQLDGVSYLNVGKDNSIGVANNGFLNFVGPARIKADNGYLQVVEAGASFGGASPYIRMRNSQPIVFAVSNTAVANIGSTALYPETTDAYDLGTSSREFRDFYLGRNAFMTGLPTTDPASAGQLWNDAGTLKISAG